MSNKKKTFLKVITNGKVLCSIFILLSIIIVNNDVYEYLHDISRKYEYLEVDDFFLLFIPGSLLFALYSFGQFYELKSSKKQLHELSLIDNESQLPNKTSFYQAMKLSQNPTVSLIKFLDFHAINTEFGAEHTDNILISAAHRLDFLTKNILSTALYRVETNLFAIVSDDHVSDSMQQITRLLKEFSNTSIEYQDTSLYLSAEAGFSSIEPYFNNAKIALENVRLDPSSSVYEYNPYQKGENEHDKLAFFNQVKDAVMNNSVRLYYQPILDNTTKSIDKYEVLMRLQLGSGRVLKPELFLALVKKFKLYPQLKRELLNKAFVFFQGINTKFSINFSWIDLVNSETMECLFEQIQNNLECANRMTIEIVESEECELKTIIAFKERLKQYGVKLAIDDFGTGYSNWKILQELRPDYIKLDGSMIKNIDTNKEIRVAVEAINKIAKEYGIKTIAEYVSTKSVYDVIKDIGIDMSQGYYFSKPTAEINVT